MFTNIIELRRFSELLLTPLVSATDEQLSRVLDLLSLADRALDAQPYKVGEEWGIVCHAVNAALVARIGAEVSADASLEVIAWMISHQTDADVEALLLEVEGVTLFVFNSQQQMATVMKQANMVLDAASFDALMYPKYKFTHASCAEG